MFVAALGIMRCAKDMAKPLDTHFYVLVITTYQYS